MIMQHLLHFLFSAPLSHPSLTPLSPVSRPSLTPLSPLPHPSRTRLSPIPHPSLTPPAPLSPPSRTRLSPFPHPFLIPPLPLYRLLFTLSLTCNLPCFQHIALEYYWDIIGRLLGDYWVIIGLLSNSHWYHTVLTLRLRSDDTPPRTKFCNYFCNFL